MRIVQLRGTIFLPSTIGYTPENEKHFRELLLPSSLCYGIIQPGIQTQGLNPNMLQPQYGMAWRLNKTEDGKQYNIVFLPGKIDIILDLDIDYKEDEEKNFCSFCTSCFSKILENQRGQLVSRIAFAPLYALSAEECNWHRFLRQTMNDGLQMQDINLSYVLKENLEISSDKKIVLNLLHNISDGYQVRVVDGSNMVFPVMLLQLDLNSIPEQNIEFNRGDIELYFSIILKIKNNIISNVTK